MNRLKAVMFDMDGVLIDSERISLNLWRQINEEWGNVFDVSVISQMMGGSPEENRRKYGHLLLPPEIYDQMRQQKMIRTRQLVEQQGMPLRPGVREMLATLKENGIRRGFRSTQTPVPRTMPRPMCLQGQPVIRRDAST